eukprot:6213444-Pleurochrysis_carterae.AAC.1
MISFDSPAALPMAVMTRCGPASAAITNWRTTSAAAISAVLEGRSSFKSAAAARRGRCAGG